MSENIDLLYITFIDMDEIPKSGSGVRPVKLYEAIKEKGLSVKLLSGRNNDIKNRRKEVISTMKWLITNRPKACYVEPPSGPFFCFEDVLLLVLLKIFKVPTGLFYRDAYWKFKDSIVDKGLHKTFVDKLKSIIIYIMQRIDWFVIQKCCAIIYFPTELMTTYFKAKDMRPLPPGCYIPRNFYHEVNNGIPTAIYVGGATERYGLPMLLDSAILANSNGEVFKLIVVCEKNGWTSFSEARNLSEYNWLEVFHYDSGDELENLYKRADFSIVPIRKNTYHDFTFPVKLSEYLSHLLPVVSTNCIELEKFVNGNGIGIVSNDNVCDFSSALTKMAVDSDFRNNCVNKAVLTRETNLWISRVEQIIFDLMGERIE